MSAKKLYQNSIEITGDSSEVKTVIDEVLDKARLSGFSEDNIFAIHLALEEALTNAVTHGNKMDPRKKISVNYEFTEEKFDVTIQDSGEGFDPDEVPDPRQNGNLFKPSGRGLLLMQEYMDSAEFNPAGNKVHMLKYKTASSDNNNRK